MLSTGFCYVADFSRSRGGGGAGINPPALLRWLTLQAVRGIIGIDTLLDDFCRPFVIFVLPIYIIFPPRRFCHFSIFSRLGFLTFLLVIVCCIKYDNYSKLSKKHFYTPEYLQPGLIAAY